MKKTIFGILLLVLSFSTPLKALDGLYLGGELGHVSLSGNASNYNNAIGFGVAVGMRNSPLLDVVFRFGYSSHSGSGTMVVYHPTLTADFHFYEMDDFDLFFGVGPGFYFFSPGGSSESKFGVNAGLGADVIVDETLRLGLGFRWHSVFSPVIGGNFWSAMMRVGYLIDM